jgi:hypothetical protein
MFSKWEVLYFFYRNKTSFIKKLRRGCRRASFKFRVYRSRQYWRPLNTFILTSAKQNSVTNVHKKRSTATMSRLLIRVIMVRGNKKMKCHEYFLNPSFTRCSWLYNSKLFTLSDKQLTTCMHHLLFWWSLYKISHQWFLAFETNKKWITVANKLLHKHSFNLFSQRLAVLYLISLLPAKVAPPRGFGVRGRFA